MASQLLPLGGFSLSPHPFRLVLALLNTHTLLELIDKCVGSRIWVIMKGDKGEVQPIGH